VLPPELGEEPTERGDYQINFLPSTDEALHTHFEETTSQEDHIEAQLLQEVGPNAFKKKLEEPLNKRKASKCMWITPPPALLCFLSPTQFYF
jgi:hypothetical protein